MRAVIYTRVSQDRSQELRSVEKQEDECRDYCRSQGWDVVRVFSDNDRGASRHSKKERPEYLALRAFLETGGADALVMWEGSRAQRDIAAYASLRDICASRGVLYSYKGRTYDLTRTDDRFSTGLDALLDERESDVIKDRVSKDMARNASAGRPHGKLAYGYAREYNDRGSFLREVVKEEEAAVIRECARRVVAGDSLYAIANDLNARGVPAPRGGKWIGTQIKRTLTGPRYVGQRVHQGVVVGPALWPAILDEATYLDCRAILLDPRRASVRDLSLKYLLSGSARCGVCGGKMRVIKNRGYHAYACHEAFCTAVRTERLEEYVVLLVLERLGRPDFLEVVAAREAALAAGGPEAVDEARALQDRLDGFYASAAEGAISPAGLASVETRLLAQIAEARERQTAARVPAVLRQVAGADIAGRWEALPVATRRKVIDTLMIVKVNKTVRGSRFSPERVDIEWKTF